MTKEEFRKLFIKAKLWSDHTQTIEMSLYLTQYNDYYSELCEELIEPEKVKGYQNYPVMLFMYNMMCHIAEADLNIGQTIIPKNFVNSNVPKLPKIELRLIV